MTDVAPARQDKKGGFSGLRRKRGDRLDERMPRSKAHFDYILVILDFALAR
jgi:hypothetical protein